MLQKVYQLDILNTIILHTRDFHNSVFKRLSEIKNRMKKAGWGNKTIRSALRRELRKIGRVDFGHIRGRSYHTQF